VHFAVEILFNTLEVEPELRVAVLNRFLQ
jgi:hypothetical protein